MVRTAPILGFVGFGGSGKTTLLERIIQILSGRGVRVGSAAPDVIAVAGDVRLSAGDLPCLDFNDSDAMAHFVADRFGLHHLQPTSSPARERCRD